MKKTALIIPFLVFTACAGDNGSGSVDDGSCAWIDSAANSAAVQLAMTAGAIEGDSLFPRSLHTDYSLEQLEQQLEIPVSEFKDEIVLMQHPETNRYRTPMMVKYNDWTSGFFPGSLWYAYELTGKPELMEQAARFTNMVFPVSYMTDTHDLGFMVGCSYGNAYRLAPSDSIKEIVVRTADNLAGRFDASKGVIRSWDFGPWNYPVIIDNMMNLRLLFDAYRITGDKRYAQTAMTHANTTMANHFRPDYTCYHVVSYDNSGRAERKQTFQGKNDDSAWARGQAWALYGYSEIARETGDTAYRNHAVRIADMFIDRNTAPDRIPYWDLDAPVLEATPRDASAAAVVASGMLDLGSQLGEDGRRYIDYAAEILRTLASAEYMARPGGNGGFVLMHSTGSLPHGSEIDTPLNYADYYFLEGLVRYKRILGGLEPVEVAFR
ncbi:MAG: glycoside hydrolase family 88 protein [Muribaculaceae bacterium]|nr:glycoside hydrolase family 88 protein [Muribaculaceae bacterium]